MFGYGGGFLREGWKGRLGGEWLGGIWRIACGMSKGGEINGISKVAARCE